MTDDALTELERIARAATPGPWEHDVATDEVWKRPPWRAVDRIAKTDDCVADAAYIAANNPEATLALIADVREARKERNTQQQRADGIQRNIQELKDFTDKEIELLTQRAEQAERERDEARVDAHAMRAERDNAESSESVMKEQRDEARAQVETLRQALKSVEWPLDSYTGNPTCPSCRHFSTAAEPGPSHHDQSCALKAVLYPALTATDRKGA